MSCNHKMLAFRNKKTGQVKFIGAVSNYTPKQIHGLSLQYPDVDILKLPCGRCIGCRLDKARQWAVRIMHEKKTSTSSSFLTLTFDEDKIYEWYYKNGYGEKRSREIAHSLVWTLDLKVFQNFMKRLRKALSPIKVRFYQVGEYGGRRGRPHFHCILFGYDFPNKKYHSYKVLKGRKYFYYTDDKLAELWPFGFHIITDVTEESACYCSRYVTKKIYGSIADEHYYGKKPEFTTMSRNKGIGYDWFQKYGSTDCYPQDFILTEKKLPIKPPRYYDSLFDVENSEAFEQIKQNRLDWSKQIVKNWKSEIAQKDTKLNCINQEISNKRKLSLLKRGLDDDENYDWKTEFYHKGITFNISKSVLDDISAKAELFKTKDLSCRKYANDNLDEIIGYKTWKDVVNA